MGRPTLFEPRMNLSTIQADFDRIARLLAEVPERADRYEAFLLARLPDPCRTVLEVGCGPGRLARAIASRGASVTGIDASPQMIRLARRRSRDGPRVDFICGDFSTFRLGSAGYDCVVSVATLHHLPTEATLERMKRLVNPGGVLMIHDLRKATGARDRISSGLEAVFNGDAIWWLRSHFRQRPALRDAWRDHGAGESYLTMEQVRARYASALPGAEIHRHPLWRYTVVWTRSNGTA